MGEPKLETSEIELNTIELPDLAFRQVTRDIEVQIKQMLVHPAMVHVLNLKNSMTIDQGIVTQLLRFQSDLKKVEKKFFCVNVDSELQKELKKRGIYVALNIFNTVDDVKKELLKAAKKSKIDAAVLRPFVEGATKAFQVQVKVAVTLGKIFSKVHRFEEGDAVAGSIAVDAEGFKGTVTICFNEKVFKSIFKKLLNEDIQTIDKDSADAAGELVNIIYGHAKTALNRSHGLHLKPVLPQVMLWPKVEAQDNTILVLPFSSEIGDFRVEIVIG